MAIIGIIDEYRSLYDKYIVSQTKLLIINYNPVNRQYTYKPYSHTATSDAIEKLSKLIVDNMVFYAFSEEEIVDYNKKFGLLDDLSVAAKYAYEQRLPKRKNADTDGTAGEILLDILIQVFEPYSQKLIARAKYKQQGDNNEIKGYDALYFITSGNQISLWLGQVKTGTCSYCKTSIIEDLNNKYILDYFCNSMFYIADKADKSSELIDLLNEINNICFQSVLQKWDDKSKKIELIKLLKNRNVKIKIPCLLAYTENIYTDDGELHQKVYDCINNMIASFDITNFNIIDELEYEIEFCIFPVSNIKELRNKLVEFKKVVQ